MSLQGYFPETGFEAGILKGTGQKEGEEEDEKCTGKRECWKSRCHRPLLPLTGGDAYIYFFYLLCIVIRPFHLARRYPLSQTSERNLSPENGFCTVGSHKERKRWDRIKKEVYLHGTRPLKKANVQLNDIDKRERVRKRDDGLGPYKEEWGNKNIHQQQTGIRDSTDWHASHILHTLCLVIINPFPFPPMQALANNLND